MLISCSVHHGYWYVLKTENIVKLEYKPFLISKVMRRILFLFSTHLSFYDAYGIRLKGRIRKRRKKIKHRAIKIARVLTEDISRNRKQEEDALLEAVGKVFPQ